MGVVTDHALQADPNALPAYTAYGIALTEQGRLPAALETFEVGLQSRRQTPGLSPWPLIHHLIAMASLTALMGDPDGRTGLLLAEVDALTPWTDASMAGTRARVAAARSLVAATTGEGPAVGEPLTSREREILQRLQAARHSGRSPATCTSPTTPSRPSPPRCTASSAPTPDPKLSPSPGDSRPQSTCDWSIEPGCLPGQDDRAAGQAVGREPSHPGSSPSCSLTVSTSDVIEGKLGRLRRCGHDHLVFDRGVRNAQTSPKTGRTPRRAHLVQR